MSNTLGRIEPAVFVLAALVWLGGTDWAAGAQDLSTPAASAAPTHSVYLEYRELDSANFSRQENVPVVYQPTPFQKEPDFGHRKVVRGTLKFGDSSEQFVAFILDLDRGRLYLDLNRNLDLTDDPGGVYSCQPRFSFSSSIGFNDVRLTFKTLTGVHPALLDVCFFISDLGKTNQPSVSVDRRYLWQGKLGFKGQDWQVGLIDSLQGRIGAADGAVLLLRPWSALNPGHPAQAGPLDLLGSSRDLFFAGQTFHVDWAYVRQDNRPKYRLEFQPRPAELGQLRLTGKFIQRLVLTRDSSQPLTVILDAPGSVAMIPAGCYTNGDVHLKRGETEASRLSDRFGQPPVSPCAPTIKAGGEAVLNAGGPLTNTVFVTRRGNSLVLDYRLLGAGGEVYEARGPHTEPGLSRIVPSALASWPSGELGVHEELIAAIAFGLAAAWLVSNHLRPRGRFVTFLGFVLALLGASSFIMLVGHLENWDGDAQPAGEFAVATSLAIASALTLAGLLCRRRYRPFVLCFWVLVLLLPVWLSVIMLWLVVDAFRLGFAIDRHQVEAWCQDMGGLVRLSFAVLLPFLILSFANPFFRERLKVLLCLRPVARP